MGRQHQGMDRPGVQQVPEGSGEQGKMKKTGCKIICGAPTTLAVKGLMMMMIRQISRRENKSSKWLHPASLPIETIICWCFAVGVDAATLESEEKPTKE